MFRQLTISLRNHGLKAPRRTARYTPEEVAILEQTFKKQLFVNQITRSRLASDFNRTEKAILMWFARRRAILKENDEHSYAALQLKQQEGGPNKPYSKFTDVQRKQLAAVFQEHQLLTDVQVEKLTDDMMVERTDILNWFRERRYRSKMKIDDSFENDGQGNDVPLTNAEIVKIQAKTLGEYLVVFQKYMYHENGNFCRF